METYTVKSGDTLSKIVQQFYGDTSRLWEVAQYNGIRDVNYLQTGQVLKMPSRLAEVEITATRIGTGNARPVSEAESFYAYDESGQRYLRVPITGGQPIAQAASASLDFPPWVWWLVGAGVVYWLLSGRRR